MKVRRARRPPAREVARLLLCAPLLALSLPAGSRAQSGATRQGRGGGSRSSGMSVELPAPLPETPVPFEDDRAGRPRVPTLSFTTPDANFERKVVKDAPFSAESETEHVQTYADGNRSARKSGARLFRDSRGRTRREHTITREGSGVLAPDGQPPRLIVINDPVDEVEYRIDTRTETTQRQEVLAAMRKARERALGNGDAPHGVLMPANVGRRAAAGEEMEPMPEPRREKLGRQTIEGVEAEGTRISITIPAGVLGTERPVEITHEEWYSPELKMIVLMRHNDPRFGKTTFRLTNVSRGEQDRALFYPPDGYKIVHPTVQRGFPGRPLPPDMRPPHRRP
jgi:hypothetical protein